LAVGAGEEDPEVIGERDEVGFVGAALLPRFAVPGRGDERGG